MSNNDWEDESTLSVIQHMNDDHADALLLYLEAFAGVDAESMSNVAMTGIDEFGISVAYEESGEAKSVSLLFADCCSTTRIESPAQSRAALVDMVQKARAQLAR